MALSDLLGLLALITFTLILGVIALLLSYLVSPRRPNLTKKLRYEAGNPPRGRARGVLSMQYYAYILVFLVTEPIFIYLFLFSPFSHSRGLDVLLMTGLVSLIYLFPLYYGLRLAREGGW